MRVCICCVYMSAVSVLEKAPATSAFVQAALANLRLLPFRFVLSWIRRRLAVLRRGAAGTRAGRICKSSNFGEPALCSSLVIGTGIGLDSHNHSYSRLTPSATPTLGVQPV